MPGKNSNSQDAIPLRVPGAAADEDDVVDGGLVHLGVTQRLFHRLQRVLQKKGERV